MNANATATASAAPIVSSPWKLTGIRSTPEGQRCDHCPRTLKNLYDLTNTETGQAMTVGRGCCKKVTGWSLTTAEARRLLNHARQQERQASVWAEFTAAHPEIAATVEADAASWRPAWNGQANLAAHFRWQVSRGAISRYGWRDQAARYMSEVRQQQAAPVL